MSELRVAHFNMLMDGQAPEQYWHQRDRLAHMRLNISEVSRDASAFILFLCEGVDAEHIESLVDGTDLEVAGISKNGDQEHIGFLADKATARNAAYHHVSVTDRPNYGFGLLRTDYGPVMGAHLPRPFEDKYGERSATVGKMIATGTRFTQSYVAMDSNTLPGIGLRRTLKKAGYQDAHGPLEARFPIAYYRRAHLPWYTPSMNIDSISARGSMELQNASEVRSLVSDHPLLWADYKVA